MQCLSCTGRTRSSNFLKMYHCRRHNKEEFSLCVLFQSQVPSHLHIRTHDVRASATTHKTKPLNKCGSSSTLQMAPPAARARKKQTTSGWRAPRRRRTTTYTRVSLFSLIVSRTTMDPTAGCVPNEINVALIQGKNEDKCAIRTIHCNSINLSKWPTGAAKAALIR